MRLQFRRDLIRSFTGFLGCPQTQIEFGKLQPRVLIEPREFRQRRLLRRLRREKAILELPEPGQRVSQ